MARYKAPKYVFFVEEYPQTASGKIQKYKLREMAAEQLGLEDVKVFASEAPEDGTGGESAVRGTGGA